MPHLAKTTERDIEVLKVLTNMARGRRIHASIDAYHARLRCSLIDEIVVTLDTLSEALDEIAIDSQQVPLQRMLYNLGALDTCEDEQNLKRILLRFCEALLARTGPVAGVLDFVELRDDASIEKVNPIEEPPCPTEKRPALTLVS